MNLELTHDEVTLLSNLLNKGLFYSKQSLETWEKVVLQNPSAQPCVDDTRSEISAYSDLIKKIESIRGF